MPASTSHLHCHHRGGESMCRLPIVPVGSGLSLQAPVCLCSACLTSSFLPTHQPSRPTTRHTEATAFQLRLHISHSDDSALPTINPSFHVTLSSSDFLTKPKLIPRAFSSCPFNSIWGQKSPITLGPGGGSHLVLSWGDLIVPNSAGPWQPDSVTTQYSVSHTCSI